MKIRLPRRAAMMAASALVVLASLSSAVVADAQTPRQLAMGVAMMPFDDLSLLDSFTATTDRRPATWSVWSAWGSVTREYPTGLVNALHARGVTPVIVWEPSVPDNQLDNHYSYRRIARGDFDKYIRRWAAAAAAAGGPVVLRWAHEANGTWFPWSYNRFDNTPARFVQAWRHIWRIFQNAGARNVKFMFSPNEPCGACASIASMYPGDAYVDYIGISSFNWGAPKPWRGMTTLYQKSMTAINNITTRKPVIVAETASTPDGPTADAKAGWVANGYPGIYAKWPRIKGVIYFNIDFTDHGHPDWRLTVPDTGPLDAYRTLLQDTRFQGSIK
ncbi:MAG: glycosyl hydrolase [Chloroflexota bacterium]